MTCREVYITLEEYREKYLVMGKLYEGFVIDYGYAYTKAKAFQPAHMKGYSPIIGSLYGNDSHYALGRQQHIDTSIEMRKLSLRGLFKLNVPFANNEAEITVRKGMTLSTIAALFDVTVADLVSWNKIKDPNRIFVGQKIRIIDKHSNTLKVSSQSKVDSVLNVGNNSVKSQTSDSNISLTYTNRVTEELDMAFLNAYSFMDATVGDAKLINGNITTDKILGKESQTSFSLELNMGLLKVGFSKNSISHSISILGYVEAETSISYENFWDMSINMEVRQNVNRDNSSSGVGLGVKPVKILALVVLVAGIVVTAPVHLVRPMFAPASVTPIVPLNRTVL